MSVNIRELRRSELLRRIEREDRERAQAALIEERVEAAVAARLAPPAEPPPRRSEMSAGEKSKYIRQFGKAAYDALDW